MENKKRKFQDSNSKEGSKPKRGKFNRFKKHSNLFNRGDDVKGILISCNFNTEDKAIAESVIFLNHFSEKYYPLTEEQKEELEIRRQKSREKKKLMKSLKKEKQNKETSDTKTEIEVKEKEESDDASEESEEDKKNEKKEAFNDNNIEKKKKVKRFTVYDTGVKGKIFVAINDDINPSGF